MKRRMTAGLLALILLAESMATGCSLKKQTETKKEVSALSFMEQYNTAAVQAADADYRTYYEVFVYSFYDSDGDGIGDLKGLTEKLDYINDGNPDTFTDLGCDGIWLMPVMPSETYHKYDVVDYYGIDTAYGTLDDFKTFVHACEKRGIHVMLDLVMNHTSSKHPWFLQACEYLRSLPEGTEPDAEECPYVDYYFFSKEEKSGYSRLVGTDWYYEAQFWSEMPDLNLGNEAVRAEFEAIAAYWLDFGVTGFRLDAAKEYYSGNSEKNIEVLSWFYDMVKAKKEEVYIVAEVWENLTSYARYYASGVSCFNFSFADNSGVIASALKQHNGKMYAEKLLRMQEQLAGYCADYVDAPFYTNHDMGRSAGYYVGENSERQIKMAQALNLLMSGSAFLYYGEELGMKGSGKDENKRAPMYWSADADAEGMCAGPAGMDDVQMKFESLKEQETDGNSIYNFVKQVILLRNQYPALSHGVAEMEEAWMNEEGICALRKTFGEDSILLVYNLAEEDREIDLTKVAETGREPEIGGVLLTGPEDISRQEGILTLPKYSAVLLVTE